MMYTPTIAPYGPLFTKGNGLALDQIKLAHWQGIRDTARQYGVCLTLVLFDHCSLKNAANWALSPLNKVNGGPFSGAMDLYTNFNSVKPYISAVVQALNGDNIIWEIINEGVNATFEGQVRDLLHSLGVTRVTSSGSNPGNIWRYSPHGVTTASGVQAGVLPNSDGQTWPMSNVPGICKAIRSIVGGGLVFDGIGDTTGGRTWNQFLASIKAP